MTQPDIFRFRFCAVLLAWLAWACMVCGCGHKPPLAGQALGAAAATGRAPRTLAVMPFADLTKTDGLASTVRLSLYERLSSLPYRDVEITTVDERLAAHGLKDAADASPESVIRLGKVLECDAVIFGAVHTFNRVFAGIYAGIRVGAEIRICDTRTGRVIWEDSQIARTHEGGLPLTLIDIPMITLRSGLHLRDDVKLQAVSDLTRQLVENLPVPRKIPETPKPGSYALQAGAFSELDRARSLSDTLKQNGYPVIILEKQKGRGSLHRVLIGPYTNRNQALEVQRKVWKDLGAHCFLSAHTS